MSRTLLGLAVSVTCSEQTASLSPLQNKMWHENPALKLLFFFFFFGHNRVKPGVRVSGLLQGHGGSALFFFTILCKDFDFSWN